MSYWDILTEDLQEYIVKLRDDEIHKFKCGLYEFVCSYYSKDYKGHIHQHVHLSIPIHIKKVCDRHITLYFLVRGFDKDTILKIPRLKYDNNGIPFIKIKLSWHITPDSSEPEVILYFKDLKKDIKNKEYRYTINECLTGIY